MKPRYCDFQSTLLPYIHFRGESTIVHLVRCPSGDGLLYSRKAHYPNCGYMDRNNWPKVTDISQIVIISISAPSLATKWIRRQEVSHGQQQQQQIKHWTRFWSWHEIIRTKAKGSDFGIIFTESLLFLLSSLLPLLLCCHPPKRL